MEKIFLVEVNGDNVKVISEIKVDGNDYSAQISPDGKEFVCEVYIMRLKEENRFFTADVENFK